MNFNSNRFLIFRFYNMIERKNCLPDRFECKNGKCVFLDMVHDGENDCGDNSDEGKEIYCKITIHFL